jgi:hypothetical protein
MYTTRYGPPRGAAADRKRHDGRSLPAKVCHLIWLTQPYTWFAPTPARFEADLSFFDTANVSARARRRPRGAKIPRNRADPMSTLT